MVILATDNQVFPVIPVMGSLVLAVILVSLVIQVFQALVVIPAIKALLDLAVILE